ncbi:diguanylate cyclase [Secundilactobacillus malefermentans]|nr:diguanylate cyclase [Secundilactobacillus malefermentans]
MSEAYQVITNCWRAVRELSVHYGKNDIKITISIGATEMVAADQLPNDVYQRADDSLYVSKEHGRDAVTIDGQTQQLLDESEHEKYAYFIKGIYDLKGDDQRRNANDLVLQ